MPRFVILMREDDHAWSKLPVVEQGKLIGRYMAWAGDLRKSGALVSGEPFGKGGRVLRANGRTVEEKPYDELAQVETGYFLVEAKDLDDATRIAKGCPALTHGETVVVRPIGHG
jgi:hypothetical protein